MVEEVHCNETSSGRWLVPHGNSAILRAQHWPLLLAGSVFSCNSSQICLVRGVNNVELLHSSIPTFMDTLYMDSLSKLWDCWETRLNETYRDWSFFFSPSYSEYLLQWMTPVGTLTI